MVGAHLEVFWTRRDIANPFALESFCFFAPALVLRVASLAETYVKNTVTLILLALFLPLAGSAQTSEAPSYPDSAEGFRHQLEDLIAIKKSGDEAAFR